MKEQLYLFLFMMSVEGIAYCIALLEERGSVGGSQDDADDVGSRDVLLDVTWVVYLEGVGCCLRRLLERLEEIGTLLLLIKQIIINIPMKILQSEILYCKELERLFCCYF